MVHLDRGDRAPGIEPERKGRERADRRHQERHDGDDACPPAALRGPARLRARRQVRNSLQAIFSRSHTRVNKWPYCAELSSLFTIDPLDSSQSGGDLYLQWTGGRIVERSPRARYTISAMSLAPEQLLQRLTELGIGHRTFAHPAVFTVEEARQHTGHLPGGHCKSLFLKDRQGGLWLLVCLDQRRIDTGRLARTLGSPRLSFGKPELLADALGVTPGSVTPFALINDRDHRVQPLLDQAMLAHDELNFHPLTNRATTTIAAADLPRFLAACGHQPRVIDLDASGVARDRGDPGAQGSGAG
jgi:Ala-tRNA(Pro) deacylase